MIEHGSDFIKLTLSFHQRQMLSFIAKRGGRIEYKYGTKPRASYANISQAEEDRLQEVARGADDSVRDMSRKLGIVRETILIGRPEGTVQLELTDIGRNVIEQMKVRLEE